MLQHTPRAVPVHQGTQAAKDHRSLRARRTSAPPSKDAVVFKYTDVRQLQRRTFKGGLAGVTFTLADGATYEIGVHSTADIRMLNHILEHYGPIDWQRDNSFRIM